MKYPILKAKMVIFLLTLILSGSCHTTNPKRALPENITYTNNDGFSFSLHGNCRDVTMHELGIALRDVNPAIIFVAIVELPDENSIFSVSTYDLGETMPLDSAFLKSVHFTATLAGEPVSDYRTVDYSIKNRNDKNLYYKISFNPETKYSVIYYVMKNDNSDILYELKAVSQSEDRLYVIQALLEDVVISSGFNDQ